MAARTGVRVASGREAGARCPACSSRVAAGEPVAVCARCGAAHHEPCWLSGGCAAFECAPANRPMPDAAPLRITFDDLHAAPMTPAPRRPRAAPAPPPRPRYALIVLIGLGLLGGSACSLVWAKVADSSAWLVGAAALAVVAIGCCVVGLSLVAQDRRRGLGGGLLGTVFGLALLVLSGLGARGLIHRAAGPGINLDGGFDLARLRDYDPPVQAAMRANAFITGPRAGGLSIGSGVILKARPGEALILTNRHVLDAGFELDRGAAVDPASLDVSVALTGQPPEKARVTWLAPDGLDLAVVSVPLRTAEARPIAYRPGQARAVVGREAFAVGNPLGMGWTHAAGHFAQVRPQRAGSIDYRLIQTSAVVHPGNSGGGLYDSQGRLVGIVTLKIEAAHDGIGFAIELDSVAHLLPPDLITPKVP